MLEMKGGSRSHAGSIDLSLGRYDPQKSADDALVLEKPTIILVTLSLKRGVVDAWIILDAPSHLEVIV